MRLQKNSSCFIQSSTSRIINELANEAEHLFISLARYLSPRLWCVFQHDSSIDDNDENDDDKVPIVSSVCVDYYYPFVPDEDVEHGFELT